MQTEVSHAQPPPLPTRIWKLLTRTFRNELGRVAFFAHRLPIGVVTGLLDLLVAHGALQAIGMIKSFADDRCCVFQPFLARRATDRVAAGHDHRSSERNDKPTLPHLLNRSHANEHEHRMTRDASGVGRKMLLSDWLTE